MKLKISIALILSLALGGILVSAQTPPPAKAPLPRGAKVIPQRNFAVCFLFARTTPELFFKDPEGIYHQLKIETSSFSSWNVIPAGPTFEVFKQIIIPSSRTIDPKTKEEIFTPEKITYKVVQTWSLPPGEYPIRKLYYYSQTGSVKEMTLTPEVDNPVSFKVNLINLLDQNVALRFDDKKINLPAGQTTDLIPVSAVREIFKFQYALLNSDGTPYVSPIKNLRFYNDSQNLTIILGSVPVYDTESESQDVISGYSSDALRLLEDISRIPPPPEPVIILPETR